MKEVTGAVIATSLVLVAVFVPGRILPGTTGILFRQFALTIAFSIAISAFNALTLTPALSALLLGREHGEKNWFFKRRSCSAAVTNGYVRALRAFLRFEAVALILFAAGLGLAYFVFRKVPQGLRSHRRSGISHRRHPGSHRSFARIHPRISASRFRPSPRTFLKFEAPSPSPASASEAPLPTPASSSCRCSPTRSARAKSTPPPPSSIGSAALIRNFRRHRHPLRTARRAGSRPVWRIPIRTPGSGQSHPAGSRQRQLTT
jgi:hypothetical protein